MYPQKIKLQRENTIDCNYTLIIKLKTLFTICNQLVFKLLYLLCIMYKHYDALVNLQ